MSEKKQRKDKEYINVTDVPIEHVLYIEKSGIPKTTFCRMAISEKIKRDMRTINNVDYK
jgi:hypothetical protein